LLHSYCGKHAEAEETLEEAAAHARGWPDKRVASIVLGSYAMALRYSFNLEEDAKLIETAVENVLAGGLRTADIMEDGKARVSTSVMGESLLRELDKLAA